MNRTILLPVLLALAAACSSTKEVVAPTGDGGASARAGFERIKALAGNWTGPGGEGAELATVEVRYRVTAAGSVVEETIMPGTEHEMVTMYHMDGDRLMLTHYCSAGNQPSMVAVPVLSKAGEVSSLRFEFERATNMPDPNAGHMHQAEITFEGSNNLSSRWTYWSEGKAGHQANFQLTRKSGV